MLKSGFLQRGGVHLRQEQWRQPAMKMIFDVKKFDFDTFEKDGKEEMYARIRGTDARGKHASAVAFGERAEKMNRDLIGLTHEGQTVEDVRPVVELIGSWKYGKQAVDSKTKKPLFKDNGEPLLESYFRIDNYRIMSGAALDLYRARQEAATRLTLAAEAVKSGSPETAFAVLQEFVALIANKDPMDFAQRAAAPEASEPEKQPEAALSATEPATEASAEAASEETVETAGEPAPTDEPDMVFEGEDPAVAEAATAAAPEVSIPEVSEAPEAIEETVEADTAEEHSAPEETQEPVADNSQSAPEEKAEVNAEAQAEQKYEAPATRPRGAFGPRRSPAGAPVQTAQAPQPTAEQKSEAAQTAAAPVAQSSEARRPFGAPKVNAQSNVVQMPKAEEKVANPEAAAAAHFAKVDAERKPDVLDDVPAAPKPAASVGRPGFRPFGPRR